MDPQLSTLLTGTEEDFRRYVYEETKHTREQLKYMREAMDIILAMAKHDEKTEADVG